MFTGGCISFGAQRSDGVGEIVILETVTLSPVGPTTITEWVRESDGKLLKILIKGARSGDRIRGGARIIRESNGRWVFINRKEEECDIFNGEQSLSKNPICADNDGVMWEIKVIDFVVPRNNAGFAEEEEPTLDLCLVRFMGGPDTEIN